MPITALLRRLRRLPEAELAAVRAYWAQVAPLLAHLRSTRDRWVDLAMLEADDRRLANTAAVYRWELAKLHQRLEALPAPPAAVGAHRALSVAFADASRGCQLLATGHRFHKSETVCDGQTLLVEAADEAERVGKALAELAAG